MVGHRKHHAPIRRLQIHIAIHALSPEARPRKQKRRLQDVASSTYHSLSPLNQINRAIVQRWLPMCCWRGETLIRTSRNGITTSAVPSRRFPGVRFLTLGTRLVLSSQFYHRNDFINILIPTTNLYHVRYYPPR